MTLPGAGGGTRRRLARGRRTDGVRSRREYCAEMGPNWAEQVTAIATAVLALGIFGAVAAALFAAQQVREARQTRQAQTTAEFFRRWNEDALVESRRLVSSY